MGRHRQRCHPLDAAVMLPRRCPFCGTMPVLLPLNPLIEGNAWGAVECVNPECPAEGPRVTDGEPVRDERGTASYQQAAILRWNRGKA
jgi:hypothetical protein